ncbi:unnamed protein product [Lota lota]
MNHLHILRVYFLFLLLRSSCAAHVKNICAYTQLASNGETHYSFLRTGHYSPHHLSPTVRLYHSVWSPDRALLKCSWVDDAAVTENYLSLCREKTNEFLENHSEHFNMNALFATNRLCDAVNTPFADKERTSRSRKARSVGALSERSRTASHLRVKRGFIVPGTLWCGSGNKALSYADLGAFMKTDSCCREHDQCQDTILSFQTKFGVFNTNIFTMSHCDCDNRFHGCLRSANDSISDVVGYTFFNLLKMNCFELSYRVICTERNWFGMCKATQTVLHAEVQSPTAYQPDASMSEANATQATPTMSVTPPADPPAMTSDLTSANTMGSDGLALVSDTSPALSAGVFATKLESSASLTTPSNSDLDQHNISMANTDKPGVLNGQVANTSQELSCEVYRELDQCRARIRPQQSRYGLLNLDPRTLYHCSCTKRLFQILANQRRLMDVDTFLLDGVSQSCFLVPDCGSGKICKAIVHSPALPKLEKTIPGGNMDDWRHLLAVSLRVRRPKSYRVKRKNGAVRLSRLCERITRTKGCSRRSDSPAHPPPPPGKNSANGRREPDRNGLENMAHLSCWNYFV